MKSLQVRTSSEQALEIIREHPDEIIAFCNKMAKRYLLCLGKHDREDFIQSFYLHLLKAITKYDGRTTISTFIGACIKQFTMNCISRRKFDGANKRSANYYLTKKYAPVYGNYDDRLYTNECIERIKQRLNAKERSVFDEYFVNQKTIRDVTVKFKIPRSTVFLYISKIRKIGHELKEI